MAKRQSIIFSSNHLAIKGWLYRPDRYTPSPCIIMSHGFSGLKEHYLDPIATYFARAGFCVLVYDQPHFGESAGEPRLEVVPETQIRALGDAITFVRELNFVAANKIGLWGTSFSSGIVIALAAQDDRAACLVLQVPFVQGHHAYLKSKKPEQWHKISSHYALDQKNRAAGKRPIMVSVVAEQPGASAVLKQPEAAEFFLSLPQWENKVTLRSVQHSGDFQPIQYIEEIRAPMLFIVAEEDTINSTSLALAAYAKATAPKKLTMIPGHHFVPYKEQFEPAASSACTWFKKYLCDEVNDG